MKLKPVQTALISVYYKEGIDDLATFLHQNGVQIISTGGTKSHLQAIGIPVTDVESLTGFPSILGGRVKTLHPAIFGGILNRSEDESDENELEEFNIGEIDLIWVDLYPFQETVEAKAVEQEIIEKIDIGGVSLIRAAAKNFRDKVIICRPDQVNKVHRHLREHQNASQTAFRKLLAGEAFTTTRQYDEQIAAYFNGSASTSLRYGENPHQKARFEGNLSEVFTQLHGKEISYNNLLDIDAALQLINDLKNLPGHTFAILKHNNACGLAIRETLSDAYRDALSADPISAFGGILATLSKVDLQTAEIMNDLFFEVLLAPDFDEEALQLLKGKKNRMLLRTKDFSFAASHQRTALNGLLIQEPDHVVNETKDFQTVTSTTPEASMMSDLHFANILVKHTKSNAIVLVKNHQLLASGTGQTSRVDALNQAIAKAKIFGFDLKGAVMASDAFFPFPDCVEIAHEAGVRGVIQPGGSIKDQLSVDFCNQHDMAMVITGMRHFKH